MDSDGAALHEPEVGDCCICGTREVPLIPFYVRAQRAQVAHGTEVTYTWQTSESACCAPCWRRVERLDVAHLWCHVTTFGPASIVTLMVFLDVEPSLGLVLAAVLGIVGGIVGYVVLSRLRRRVLHTPTFEGLRASMSLGPDTVVVPLASSSDSLMDA